MPKKKIGASSSKTFYLEPKHIFWFFENYPHLASESVYQEVTRIMQAKRDGTLKRKYRPVVSWKIRSQPQKSHNRGKDESSESR